MCQSISTPYNNKKIFLRLQCKQGRKRPLICIKCNKKGTFGEWKRDKEKEREIVLGYYTGIKKVYKKVWPKLNRLIFRDLLNVNLKLIKIIIVPLTYLTYL